MATSFYELLNSQSDGLLGLLNTSLSAEADHSELVAPLIELLAKGESAMSVANFLGTRLDAKPQMEAGLEIVEWASGAVATARGYFVSAERLGWPRRGSFGAQHGMQFPISPNQPTATCHIQTDVEDGALCGHPLEFLAPVPLAPMWTSILPALRCDACASLAGALTADETEAGSAEYVGELTQP